MLELIRYYVAGNRKLLDEEYRMRGRPYRMRAVEEYWWHTEIMRPDDTCEHTRKFADAAIIALETTLQRIQDAAQGRGLVDATLSFEELTVLFCGKQDRISFLERLLDAAYELYADDGYLVTKEEWLEALQCQVKEDLE